MNFYPLTIRSITKLTQQSIKIDLEIPQKHKDIFVWKPGQFLRFKFKIEGKEVEREYSICTAPYEGCLSFAVKQVTEGFVSKYVQDNLKVNDVLEVSTPMGNFGILSRPNEKRTLAAFVGGSGITPVMSIIKDTLHNEDDVNFYLFYGNRNEKDIMFKDELEELKDKYPNNFHLHHFYSEQEVENKLFEGLFDAHKLDLIINQIIDWDEVDETLLCGPKEMIVALANAIHKRGIPKENIKYELFVPIDKIFEDDKVQRSDIKEVNVTYTYKGKTEKFIWFNNGNSLLETLLDIGVEAPYSCKGGVCGSCRCTKTEGEVLLGENMVLTEEDIERNKILTCVAHPKTEKFVFNMDEY